MTNNSYNNSKYNSDHKTDTQVIISNTIHLLPHYYRGGGSGAFSYLTQQFWRPTEEKSIN